MTRLHEVSGHGAWRVAAGRRDPFLYRRRVNWGNVFGLTVLLSSAAFWGLIAALFIRARMQ